MRTLWGRADSLNVQKVSWTLAELGLDHERKDLGGSFGGLDDPAFRAKNPNGLIPVLEDGDVVLWESNAIVRYLSKAYGAGALWPSSPSVQAIADQWMDWQATTLWPPVRVVFLQQFRTPDDQRDSDLIGTNAAAAEKALWILNRAVERSDSITGHGFCAADIVLGTVVNRYGLLSDVPPLPPAVDAWFGGLADRSGFKATFG